MLCWPHLTNILNCPFHFDSILNECSFFFAVFVSWHGTIVEFFFSFFLLSVLIGHMRFKCFIPVIFCPFAFFLVYFAREMIYSICIMHNKSHVFHCCVGSVTRTLLRARQTMKFHVHTMNCILASLCTNSHCRSVRARQLTSIALLVAITLHNCHSRENTRTQLHENQA